MTTVIKAVVAHLKDSFFIKSETFIYNCISSFTRFKPICLAKEFNNLDYFPFPEQNRFEIVFPYSKKDRILFVLFRRYRKIIQVLKREKAVLLHAHFGPSGVFALPFAKELRIPLITTFYGYDISKLARDKTWLRKYKILFKQGDFFLVEGSYMKSCLVALGCHDNKIKIQRIAIPLEKTPFRERLPKKQEENVIFIFAGRFVEKKGLIYALQAFREARKELTNFEFRIIGDGLLKSQIYDFVQANLMDSYVKFLGFLSYDEYLKEMEKADIFIHPSVTAYDGDSEGGAPTTILEAQAMGMPIIATNHADIPNVTLPGQSALLSEERDIVSLTQNIKQLLISQNSWGRMGRAGRKFVEDNHDLKIEAEILEDIYDTILKS